MPKTPTWKRPGAVLVPHNVEGSGPIGVTDKLFGSVPIRQRLVL